MARVSPEVLKYVIQMDRALGSGNVMPSTWTGFARIKAFDQTEGLSGEARSFAVALAERVSEKNPNASPEAVASKAVEKTEEKFA